MKIDALLMDPLDNVVTCVRDVAAGETVVYRNGDTMCEVVACQDIPYCHKIALEDLAAGAVLILAAASVIIGLLIFLPKIISLFLY